MPNWNEAVPSGTSTVEPSIFRQVLQTIAANIATTLEWPGSGGGSVASAAEIKPGKSLAFYAAKSAISAGTFDNIGRLAFDSGNSVLYVLESNATFFAGSPRHVSMLSQHPLGQVWTVKQGRTTGVSASAVSKGISFGFSFTTVPEVFVTASLRSYNIGVSGVTVSGFTSAFSYYPVGGEAGSDFTIFWTALGVTSMTGQG